MKMPASERGRRSERSKRRVSMIAHQGLQTQRDVARQRGARRPRILTSTSSGSWFGVPSCSCSMSEMISKWTSHSKRLSAKWRNKNILKEKDRKGWTLEAGCCTHRQEKSLRCARNLNPLFVLNNNKAAISSNEWTFSVDFTICNTMWLSNAEQGRSSPTIR